jgi:hypothetical protein
MRATIDTYFVPNKTIRELHELIESCNFLPHNAHARATGNR